MHTKTHDEIRNTFVIIVWDASFHVGWKQLHVFPSNMFNSSCWWIDIMFTKGSIRTLVKVVIVDPTQVDLHPQSCTTQGFVASNVAQAKKRSYHDQHPANQFLPLVVEVFRCLHKQTDVFLHNCANAIWSLKGWKTPILLILDTFFQQKNSIILQEL